MMQTVLMIREPDSVVAADAFTGLRKQVASASKHHWAHMAQLAEMDVALEHAQSLDEMKKLVAQWLSTAGLARVSSLSQGQAADAFDVVSEEGPEPVVVQPAYVDRATGRVIKNGRVAFVALPTRTLAQPAPERAKEHPIEAAIEMPPPISNEEVADDSVQKDTDGGVE